MDYRPSRPAITQLDRERRTARGVHRDMPARMVSHEILSSNPYFRTSKGDFGLDADSLPLVLPDWDEVEDWDDAMPMRPTRTPNIGEWDAYDGIDPAWVIGPSEGTRGETIKLKGPPSAAWPKRVRCVCGHTRTAHLSTRDGQDFGRCKNTVTTIAPDGGFGEEPCPCVQGEPLKEAS